MAVSVEPVKTERWLRYPEQMMWAVLTAVVSSMACVALREFFGLLQWILTRHGGELPDAAAQLPLWHRALVPVAGGAIAAAIVWMAHRRWRQDRSRDYVEAVQLDDGEMQFRPVFWRTMSSAFSVGSGAAIGREGSMIQFAAGVVSWCGGQGRQRRWQTAMPLARQVACGVAAAVATVYQAPIAGWLFAAEIVLGEISPVEAPLLLAAGFTGVLVSQHLLGAGPIFRAGQPVGVRMAHLWLTVVLALLMGLAGPAYFWLTHSLRAAKKLPAALVWGGAVVGVLSLKQTEVWGNGNVGLLHVMQHSPAVHVVLLVLVLRLFATACCVGTGTVGGVFTPTLFAGGSLGLLFGYATHAAMPVAFAVLGMGCLLAAVTHAPWMSIFMTVELTGQWKLFPLLVACSFLAWVVARSISSHRLYALAVTSGGATNGAVNGRDG